jgi:hypothetical protein
MMFMGTFNSQGGNIGESKRRRNHKKILFFFSSLLTDQHISLSLSPLPLGRSQKQLLMSRGIASVKDYYRKGEKKR